MLQVLFNKSQYTKYEYEVGDGWAKEKKSDIIITRWNVVPETAHNVKLAIPRWRCNHFPLARDRFIEYLFGKRVLTDDSLWTHRMPHFLGSETLSELTGYAVLFELLPG